MTEQSEPASKWAVAGFALCGLLMMGVIVGSLFSVGNFTIQDKLAEDEKIVSGKVGYSRYSEGKNIMGAGWLLVANDKKRYVLTNFSEKIKTGCRKCGYDVTLKLKLLSSKKNQDRKAKIIEVKKNKKLPCKAP